MATSRLESELGRKQVAKGAATEASTWNTCSNQEPVAFESQYKGRCLGAPECKAGHR